MKPIYRFDKLSSQHWIEFDGKPDQATIDLLKKEGWRWSGYRKQWHTNRRFAKPPTGIEYEDGGECDYSSERPERLRNAAARAESRSEVAYERSNALVQDIPLGQPVLVGHHSQRAHEKTLERARNAMNQSVEEQKKSEWLEQKAASSARHQSHKEQPDVIARRIKRLKGEITSIKNDRQRSIERVIWDVRNKSITTEEAKEKIAKIKVARQDIVEQIEAEIKENEDRLQEAGGLVADHLTIEVGDVIMGRWQGRSQVEKINKRNGEITSYTCKPLSDTWCSKRIIPITDVRGIVQKADGSIPRREETIEVSSVPDERLETPKSVPFALKEEKEERVFKCEEVQTITIGAGNETSLFPTPPMIAEQLVMEIPTTAQRILEPSAGTGALIQAVKRRCPEAQIDACEIIGDLLAPLEQQGAVIVGTDFLEMGKDPYQWDAIIMNPPFHGTTWLAHFEHALKLLKPGGTLVGIAPQGFVFRQEKRIKAFREMVEEYGWWQELPEDTFIESGTSVRTVMLFLRKPGEEQVDVQSNTVPLSQVEQIELWA
jgi:phospholipid N-methyltransferase